MLNELNRPGRMQKDPERKPTTSVRSENLPDPLYPPRFAGAFEWALHGLVGSLSAPALGKVLGIEPKYLSRMANPNDTGAHFRAKDLGPAMFLGICHGLPAGIALAPLQVLAGQLGCAVATLPQPPTHGGLVLDMSKAHKAIGDLGQAAVVSIDPASHGGADITAAELEAIASAGHRLHSHIQGVVLHAAALAGATHA